MARGPWLSYELSLCLCPTKLSSDGKACSSKLLIFKIPETTQYVSFLKIKDSGVCRGSCLEIPALKRQEDLMFDASPGSLSYIVIPCHYKSSKGKN